jgi:hypothetical protein
MSDSVSKNLSKVIQIDEKQIRDHLGELVRAQLKRPLTNYWMLKLTNFATHLVMSAHNTGKIREPGTTNESFIQKPDQRQL